MISYCAMLLLTLSIRMPMRSKTMMTITKMTEGHEITEESIKAAIVPIEHEDLNKSGTKSIKNNPTCWKRYFQNEYSRPSDIGD